MNPEILSESPIAVIELNEEIAKIKKRDETPSFRVTRTEEYLNAVVANKKNRAKQESAHAKTTSKA